MWGCGIWCVGMGVWWGMCDVCCSVYGFVCGVAYVMSVVWYVYGVYGVYVCVLCNSVWLCVWGVWLWCVCVFVCNVCVGCSI